MKNIDIQINDKEDLIAGKGIRYWFKQPENIRKSLKDKE